METTAYKYFNKDFFDGPCLLIRDRGEFAVLDLLSYKDGTFSYWHTTIKAQTPKEFENILYRSEWDTLGTSQTADLQTILQDCSDAVLGAIYREVVGYDPFAEDPTNPNQARKLVIDYMVMPETIKEIF